MNTTVITWDGTAQVVVGYRNEESFGITVEFEGDGIPTMGATAPSYIEALRKGFAVVEDAVPNSIIDEDTEEELVSGEELAAMTPESWADEAIAIITGVEATDDTEEEEAPVEDAA